MRCFTVAEGVMYPRIASAPHPYPHVPVGRRGPNEWLTMLPLGTGFRNELYEDGTFDRAHLLRNERSTLMVVEERYDTGQALVKFAVPGGRGGMARLYSTEYREEPCTYRGGLVPFVDVIGVDAAGAPTPPGTMACVRCGARCAENPAGDFEHPPEGFAPHYEDLRPVPYIDQRHRPRPALPAVFTIAEGMRDLRAEGGSRYPETVVVMDAGTGVRVLRTGALAGAPAAQHYYWDGDALFRQAAE